MNKSILSWLAVALAVFGVIVIGNAALAWRSRQSPPSPPSVPLEANRAASDIASVARTLDRPTVDTRPLRNNPPDVLAKSYIVIDASNKYPLTTRDPDTLAPIASITKIMTAMVVLQTLPLDKVVTVSADAATITGSEIQLLTGETITVRNLLYALLINSANDAAMALAQANTTPNDFVARMNQTARDLGLTNTIFKDPAGLDDSGHSTPRDIALLMSYAMSNPIFRDIAATPRYTITSVNGRYNHVLKTSNRLIDPEDPLYYPNAMGGKTGFTYVAGHCLVAVADVNGKRYVAVILNTNNQALDASAREARKLLVWSAQ